ncbi:hypothetical protein EVAR_37465_1 [Eumeta japonica]|uniref:Uncharacterized protein n=1 Tax=Eumeta variegata TaxID=151549 RepID=A0A4C1XBD5_EUMVA|nr:hypothetical protein EVAR_37465_1 [Eumeta japonica]
MKHGGHLKLPKEDAVASQSENAKYIEFDDDDDDSSTEKLHGGNLKSYNEYSNTRSSHRGNNYRNAKIVELLDDDTKRTTAMHGGNLKSINDGFKDKNQKPSPEDESKNGKFIELGDTDDDHNSRKMHGGNFKSYSSRPKGSRWHGGNYRSAQAGAADAEVVDSVGAEDKEKVQNLKRTRDPRGKAADLLNSFAQAVPVLTTTPAYILDPSKRMYYYVD